MTSSRFFFIGVFLISACLMALQILQSRIFSVTTWYHLAFLVISIAMFGMTMAALNIHRGDAKKQREKYTEMMAKAADDFGLYIIVALLAQLFIPILYTSFWASAISLPLLSLLTVLPYYKAGVVLTLALTRAPFPVAKTYGIDLIGAASGCMLALLLMKILDAPSAILVLSITGFCAALCFGKMVKSDYKSGNSKFLMFAVGGALLLNVLSPSPLIYPVWIKSRAVMQNMLAHDQWNAISRVTVKNEKQDSLPFLWGPSERLPEDTKASYYYLEIDGDASTPITKFSGNTRDLSYLEYDVTTMAYAMPGIDKAAVIGVGGGRDVLSAHYFGVRDITAMDVNNIQISLLRDVEPFKTYAGIADMPGVKLIHSEARSWFSAQEEKFDLIQMSLIDTWAATGAGAFALSENGLYTTQALNVFMDDLSEGGALTVSRWYTPEAQNEMERLLALAMQSLFERGIEKPIDHIFIATGGRIATMILSRAPLSLQALSALEGQAQRYGFKILVSPNKIPDSPVLRHIRASENADDLQKVTSRNPFDISPPTDNRPFFFNQMRLGDPLLVLKLIHDNSGQAILGHARATLNLYMILVFAFLMVVFAILRPLRGSIAGQNKTYIAAGTAWFLLIGLGFMLLEVALLQRMSIFLGHPVYGLGIVLFSLVLSTGLGSFLSETKDMLQPRQRAIWIAAVCGVSIALAFLLGPAFTFFADAQLMMRAVTCISMIVPLGLLLGFGFPAGMALVKAIDEKPSAWFWGINGAAGVMGSALAVALNIGLGLHVTLILGGLCYGALVIPSFILEALKPQKG